MSSLQRSSFNEDNLEYCLKHLVAYDLRPLKSFEEAERFIPSNIQHFINKISTISTKRQTEDGIIIDLPKTGSIQLPRILPVPKPKKPTKWEKYAQEKGIHKRKRSRLVWDETTNDWAPRWGYKSKAKNEKKIENMIVELKKGDKIEDVFEGMNKKTQIKKTKQNIREIQNIMRNEKQSKIINKNINKTNEFKTIMKRAQQSTASFGRHDKVIKGEPKKPQIYQKIVPKSLKDEKDEYSKIIKKIISS